MEILTTGYQLWDAGGFDAEVKRLGATVIDIRLRAWSKDPEWRADWLRRRLGARSYVSVPALGNLNYKAGGPVVLKDTETGISIVLERLKRSPVILLCACWDASSCHRSHVADILRARGLLTRELETPKPDRGAPGQGDLFR